MDKLRLRLDHVLVVKLTIIVSTYSLVLVLEDVHREIITSQLDVMRDVQWEMVTVIFS